MQNIKDVVRHLSPQSMADYCKVNSLTFQPKDEDEPKDMADNFSAYFDTLDANTRAKVEMDLQEIKDIASEKGAMMLCENARKQTSLSPAEEKQLDEMSTYDKAVWFYLKQPKLFSRTAMEYEIENAVGWLPYNITPTNKSNVLGKENILGKAVKEYFYSNEMRGRLCTAECMEKDELICYVAYPQDYMVRDISYDTKSELNKQNKRQPVFKVYFLYSPSENRIYVKTKGGTKKKENLIKIFGKEILGQELKDSAKVEYNLNALKDFDMPFGTPPEDGVEEVKVVYLRVSYPTSTGRQITFRGHPTGHGLIEMKRWIKDELNLPIEEAKYNITQAKIRVKFKKEKLKLKRAKGTITAEINYPSSCNLGVKSLDLKVKQYLKDWGIDKPAF